MSKTTRATQALQKAGIAFTLHPMTMTRRPRASAWPPLPRWASSRA
ncbi:hypothetical protein ACFQU7_02130 [Pseudoroseomonas wenyumeiae]